MRAPVSLMFISVLGLSACAESAAITNVEAYNDKIASHSNPFIQEINANTAVPLTAPPVEGVATMTGTFLVQTPAGMTGIDQIGGQVDMSADFAAGTVTGTMYNFIETYTDNTAEGIRGSASYTGTIAVGNGTYDDVTAGGSGTFITTENEHYSISTTMNGDIYRRAGGELASAGVLSANATRGTTTHGLVGTYHVTE